MILTIIIILIIWFHFTKKFTKKYMAWARKRRDEHPEKTALYRIQRSMLMDKAKIEKEIEEKYKKEKN